MLIYLVDFIVCALALALYVELRNRRIYKYLPPGPPRLPLIGSLLEVPERLEWEVYAQWGRQLNSDMVHIAVGQTPIIVVNSIRTANDLLDKRSSLYSDRPWMPMLCDLMGWGWATSIIRYSEEWREQRRLFQNHFHPLNTAVYEDTVAEFVRECLSSILDTPQDFMDHVRSLPGGVSLSLAYGIKTKPLNDPFTKLAEDALETIGKVASPGAFLVDIMPVLKYMPEFLPGAGFKRKAREWYQLMVMFREKPFAFARKQIELGYAKPSFTSMCLEGLDASKPIEPQLETVIDAAATVYAGAAHTTVSAISTFIIAMIYYPDVQKKAQAELDQVVGSSRLPEFSDRRDLPYITAILKEVLRWKPVTPLGIVHRLMEDDTYNGYIFPKGSLFLPNQWAMLHNEEDYPDPNTFKPERYLNSKGEVDPKVRDPATIAFGFGRRACPGSHIAEAMIWLTAASILSTFNIKPAVDENGTAIMPSLVYRSTTISFPQPFKCDLKPRSMDAEVFIQTLKSDAE
ncbi:cytochrome P450 [Crucibulum laeve]|uniref:Cytochrome P450 n=1 Tax=Crucibulum laeve TaxID=68775 RepID=A0A5C3M939_9AGAR|nr:cytochrome P450 [Crucibulum laeve]